jgi:hypothetical protein
MSQNLWFAEPADHDGTALPLRTSSHAHPQPDALTASFRRGCLAHSPPESKVKARLSCGQEMLIDKFSQRLVGAHPKDRAGETRRFESGSHKQPEIIPSSDFCGFDHGINTQGEIGVADSVSRRLEFSFPYPTSHINKWLAAPACPQKVAFVSHGPE